MHHSRVAKELPEVNVKSQTRYNILGGRPINAAGLEKTSSQPHPWQPRQTTYMHDIDTELIRRAQQGDAALVAELYEHFHFKVFRYLFYRVGDLHTAEDLTSEVFERMLRFLGGFQASSASFQAWLFHIARNLAIDHYRRTGVRQQVELPNALPSSGDDPSAAVDRSIVIEKLHQAIAALADDQRDVIAMRFIAGLPVSDVARALGKSEDAVKGLQRRGLLNLRASLNSGENPHDI